MKPRVVVAMSGGVDSSVAALLLLEEGYDVIGVTMQLWGDDKGLLKSSKQRGCCSIGAVNDAFSVASALGIPHYVVNLQEEFKKTVISNFTEEYLAGRTPNPCIRCNEFIKFGLLFNKALSMGAKYLATGHYVRIRRSESGRYQLLRGKDPVKDQSYVLHTLTQKQISHCLFPVGNYSKEEIRSIASLNGLTVADKPDSQEICFVPGKDYTTVLKEMLPEEAFAPGPIYDVSGNVLGGHKGLMHYTVGQRKKLCIEGDEPKYVVSINSEKNAIIAGGEPDLYQDTLYADNVNWVSISSPVLPVDLFVKIRSQAPLVKGRLSATNSQSVTIKFFEPQRAITPGQAVAFYDKDMLLGGGTIMEKRIVEDDNFIAGHSATGCSAIIRSTHPSAVKRMKT